MSILRTPSAPVKPRCGKPQDCRACDGLGWRYDCDGEALSCDDCCGTGLFPAPGRTATVVPLLNVKQVAGILNVSRRSVVRLLAGGDLRRIKVRHSTAVDPRDLADFIHRCRA